MAAQLHNGLEQQIEQFLSDHLNTDLIVIDTLQHIRKVVFAKRIAAESAAEAC